MELNDIELPAIMIADLYKSSLIELPEGKSKTKDQPQESNKWKFLGENNKNILIIVNSKEAVHLNNEQLNFLINLLSACKLSLGDVSIVNVNNYPNVNYKDLKDYFKSKIIFLFDVDPVSFGLPVSFPHFQVQLFSACTFLFMPSLNILKNDQVLKSKVWVCLRRIFGI